MNESALSHWLDQKTNGGNWAAYGFLGGLTWGLSRGLEPHVRLNIGSVTKTVTATLALMLEGEGKIRLSGKVCDYLPGFRHKEVELRHLMLHTAGFNSERQKIEWPKDQAHFAEYENSLYGADPVRPVDEASEYFSPGYSLLMLAMERAAGERIQQIAKKRLFDPLGMEDTGYDATALPFEKLLPPRELDGSRPAICRDQPATGDSGLWSTVPDLIQFGRIYLPRERGGIPLLKEEIRLRALSECTGGRFQRTEVFWRKGERDSYGFFGQNHSPMSVGHTGYSGCALAIDPERGTVEAVLSDSQALHTDWSQYAKAFDLMEAEGGIAHDEA